MQNDQGLDGGRDRDRVDRGGAGGPWGVGWVTGRVAAWGWNAGGQLGNNSTTSTRCCRRRCPRSGVLAGKRVTAISAGGQHTCAIADGRAYCWGKNGRGQLGNNSTKDSLVPVAVSTSGVLRKQDGDRDRRRVQAHVASRLTVERTAGAGTTRGQLGNNSTTDSSVPVAVSTSGVLRKKKVTAISAGGFHTCVVADGRAYCWGANLSGQLGSKAKIDYTDRASCVSRCQWRSTPRARCTTRR